MSDRGHGVEGAELDSPMERPTVATSMGYISRVDGRLELFRGYIDRLDPAAAPRRALREDLYVEPPGRAVGDQLAVRLQLAPASAHLVVGSVGAGKSTQLLRAATLLRTTPDTNAAYVDVSLRHDLDKDLRGVLLALAGLELAKRVKKRKDNSHAVVNACRQFELWAHGGQEFVPHDGDDGDDDDESQWNPYDHGYFRSRTRVLFPPLSSISSDLGELVDGLKTLKASLPEEKRHFVVFFDSLDRLAHVDAFRAAIAEDIVGLRQAGVGIVVVGPGRVVYGANRPVVDLFDQMHTVPALDVVSDLAARDFLGRVLLKRTDDAVLHADMRNRLVEWSSGILRDLLGLTRNAVEEAFVSGADIVIEAHVARAADQFGRSMMIGLRAEELATLQRLRRRGAFVPTTDDELALLESRRVVEYAGVTRRYAVHSTIEPLLASLEP